MSFSVNLKALYGLPLALDRREHDITRGRIYVAENTRLQAFGLADVTHVHETVIAHITGYLDDLGATYASVDSQRLGEAIDYYHHSDLRAAKRTDAAIVGAPSGLASKPLPTAAARAYGPSVFDDHRSPSQALIPPADHHADIPYKPNWTDVFSPTSMGRDAIWRVTEMLANAGILDRPVDPLDTFVRPVVGDWAGLLRCAEVFTHLGAMLPAASSCVSDVVDLVPLVWTGNVAGMCAANLDAFATSLADGFAPLTDLASTYRQVAIGVHDNADLLETAVVTLVDMAADILLDTATDGFLDVLDVTTEIRDFIGMLRSAMRIADNIANAVSDWKSGTGSVANRLGVLSGIGAMPTIVAPAPPILLPTD